MIARNQIREYKIKLAGHDFLLLLKLIRRNNDMTTITDNWSEVRK
jgi:hypothetical protein